MAIPALAIIAIGATVNASEESKRASAARQRQAEAEKKISILQQKREKRNQLRQARVQRAAVQAQAIGQGGSAASPSSATQGAQAGIESQYAYNLSFLDQAQAYNAQAFKASSEARVFESKARESSSYAGLATAFMSSAK